ncbi:MAG: DNA-binding response regulator [Caldilineae bacterium]|nr:MAG: DNA-binding response regulator [Caldilineae bacterium]
MTARSRPIRVLIVDDHAVVRSGLATMLEFEDDLLLVGEAENGQEAVELCARLRPDVVLMDLVMPVMDGIKATRIIRERYPDTQVVVLTSYHDKQHVQQAMEAGAIAYLMKSVSADRLAEAVRAATEGKPSLSPEAAQVLIQAATLPQAPIQQLSVREREVLELMVKGYSNPEIADKLGVSRSTAKFHVSRILHKLNAKSRIEAVTTAMQHNLI